MRVSTVFLVFFGLFLTACGGQASKETPVAKTEKANVNAWNLVNAKSHLEFISIKKGTIIETHSFDELGGSIDKMGNAKISISLDSVETNIAIRNERMRKYLFETDKSPSAIMSTKVEMNNLAAFAIGERVYLNRPIKISMHGISTTMDVDMMVTRLGTNRVVVDSRRPVIVDVNTFGFQDGVEKLRQLAKLPTITPEVPVMFSLVFER